VCLRDGIEEQVQYDNIVVGDVIKIKPGMNIPVDGVVIKAFGL
jgi:cation transport ATPase